MQRGPILKTILVTCLFFWGLPAPGFAESSPPHTKLKMCGVESTIRCLQEVQISFDDGGTWTQLPQMTRNDSLTVFNLSQTAFASSDANANALYVSPDYIQVAGSDTESKSNNIQIWAYIVDSNQTIDPYSSIEGLEADSNALFRFVFRSGDLVPTYTVGQIGQISSSSTIGAEFNTLTVQGKFRKTPHFAYGSANYWSRCNSTAHETADLVGNHFQTMTFQFFGENMFAGVDVAYSGSCSYLLDMSYDSGSTYPTLIIQGTGPHFLPDGQTLNNGHFEALLTQDFLLSKMYLSTEAALNGGLVAQARYAAGIEAVTYTVKAEGNGSVRLVADGLHFSSPKLLVKRSGKAPKSIKVSGKSAQLGVKVQVNKKQVASLIGASNPAKSKLTLTISKASKKSKICKVVGGKLKTLKPGNCVVTIKMQAKKAKGARKSPVPVYTTSTIAIS